VEVFALTDEDGVLRGPFNAFLFSATLGDALERLGGAVRYGSSLSDRVREMTILVVAAYWDSAFEREAHEAVGKAAGLNQGEMRAIRERRIPPLADPREAACLAVAMAMVAGDIDDEIWDECLPPLDQAPYSSYPPWSATTPPWPCKCGSSESERSSLLPTGQGAARH